MYEYEMPKPYGPAAINPPDPENDLECETCGLPLGDEHCYMDDMGFCDYQCLSEWIADHSDELALRWGSQT